MRAAEPAADSSGGREQAAGAEPMAETATGQAEGTAPAAGEAGPEVAREEAPEVAREETPEVAREEAPPATQGAEETGSTGVPATHEAEGAEGSRFPAVPSRRSMMNHGKRAERLMKQVCLPEFQAELHGQGAGAFFREAYVAQLWATNSLAAMKTVLSNTDATLRSTRQALEEATARAERAEEAAEASRFEAAEAVGQLDAARSAWAADVEAARDQATTEIERRRIMAAELDMVNSAIKARDRQIESFVSVVRATEARAASAEAQMEATEARAASAEARMREMEAVVAEAEKRAAVAEAAARSAEAQAARAVEEFRSSEAFRVEVADASAGAFVQGFEDGRDTVGRLFGLSDLAEIGPGDAIAEPRTDEGPTGAEAATEGIPDEAPRAGAQSTMDEAAERSEAQP